MIESQVITFLLTNWGWLGGILGVGVLVLIRFGPAWLQGMREKRLAQMNLRAQTQQVHSQREQQLFERLDRKDAVLEKISSNHIAHLEQQLAASQGFFEAALRTLVSLDQNQKELRTQVSEIEGKLGQVKDDTTFLRGRGS